MRSKLAFLMVGFVALLGAGLAIARSVDNSSSLTAVSGTFVATAASGKSDARTCTTTDGKTLVSTHASYAGTSSGSPDLTGAVSVDTHSLINVTDGIGKVDARFRIVTGGGKTELRFTGVYDHGNLAGLAMGHAATHAVRLVGNLSAGFSAAGGFTDGKVGAGSSGGSAIEVGPGRCAPTKPSAPKPAPPKPGHEKSEAVGAVTAVSSTSITVAGLTCIAPSSLATQVVGFKLGDRVRIRCRLSDGTSTLVKIDKH